MDEKVDVLMRKAQKFLQSAAVLLELEDYDSCASRAYFAMFYAAQALLLQEGYTYSPGQGIRATFLQAFIASGRLPERAGEALTRLAELQEVGDYAQEFAVPQEAAERGLQEAEAFVNSIDRWIDASV